MKKEELVREKDKEDMWISTLNCRGCPYPLTWKKDHLCSICATLCKDKDGNLFIALRPIVQGEEQQ